MTTIAGQLSTAKEELTKTVEKRREAGRTGNWRAEDRYIEQINAWRSTISRLEKGEVVGDMKSAVERQATGEITRSRIIEAAKEEAKAKFIEAEKAEIKEFASHMAKGYSMEKARRLTGWAAPEKVGGIARRPQASVPQQPTISEPQQFIPMSQSWQESTKQFVERLPEGGRKAITGFFTMEDTGGAKYIFDPFKYSGEMIGKEKIKVSGFPQFGTRVSEEYLKPEHKPFEGTKFEYAEFLGVTDPSLYQRTGTRISKYAPVVLETGVTIGASLTPAGSAIVSGYVFQRGVKQVFEAPTIPGKALGVLGIVAGLYGMSATMKGLQTSITMGEMTSAIKTKPLIKVGVQERLKGGIIKQEFGARYKIGDVSVFKSATIKAKQFKGGYLVTGEGEVLAGTTMFMTGKPVTYGYATTSRGVSGAMEVSARGWQPGVSVGAVVKKGEFLKIGEKTRIYINEKLVPSFKGKTLSLKSEGIKIISKPYKPESFFAGGIAKEEGRTIISLGGKARIPKSFEIYPGVTARRTGFEFDVEEVMGIIKLKTPSDIGFIKTTGIKSSPEYFQKLYAPPIPKLAEKLVQQPIINIESSRIIPSVSAAVVSVATRIKLKAVVKPSIKEKVLVMPKEKLMSAQIPKTKQKIISVQKIKTSLGMISPSKEKLKIKQVPALAQTQAQVLKQRQKLKLKQVLVTQIIPSTTITPSIETSFKFGLPPPFIWFPKFQKKESTRKVIKVKRISPGEKYRPSLVALGLGIKSPKIPKEYLRGAGGIIVRPIITKKIKRKMGLFA